MSASSFPVCSWVVFLRERGDGVENKLSGGAFKIQRGLLLVRNVVRIGLGAKKPFVPCVAQKSYESTAFEIGSGKKEEKSCKFMQ